MSEQYNKSLLFQYNLDENNVPFTPIIPSIDVVPKNLTIVTEQTIDMNKGGVEILSPTNLIEVDSEVDLKNGNNKYLVLPERGQIKFSQNLEGEYIYYTIGGESAQYMTADRICMNVDSDGNVKETMQSMYESVSTGIQLYKSAEDLRALITSMELNVNNANNASSTLSNSVVIANQTNVALNKTNDNAKAEDTALKSTTQTATSTNATLNNTNAIANNTNNTLNTTIGTGNTLKTDLSGLNDTATQTKADLDISNTTASATKSGLDTSIGTGNTLKTGLDNDITAGNTLKSDLTTLNTNATTTKNDLTTINATATQTKTDLTTINSTATTTKTNLTSINSTAQTTKTQLETAISNGDLATMQTNINSKANDTLFVGMVVPFATPTTPTGWLKCNGALVSRTTYARLFAVIGVTIGAGDGSTTFALPNIATANGLTYYIRS